MPLTKLPVDMEEIQIALTNAVEGVITQIGGGADLTDVQFVSNYQINKKDNTKVDIVAQVFGTITKTPEEVEEEPTTNYINTTVPMSFVASINVVTLPDLTPPVIE